MHLRMIMVSRYAAQQPRQRAVLNLEFCAPLSDLCVSVLSLPPLIHRSHAEVAKGRVETSWIRTYLSNCTPSSSTGSKDLRVQSQSPPQLFRPRRRDHQHPELAGP